MDPLALIPNRRWHRERNRNDAYLEDINPLIIKINELVASPGITHSLGYYATLGALQTAHPTGTPGDFAIVVDTIYLWDPNSLSWVVAGSEALINVTYAQLMTLIGASELEPGRLYQITDYQTVYNLFDGATNVILDIDSGPVEEIIVMATSPATLAREAFQPAYPYDVIYYEPTGADVLNDIAYSDGAGTLIAGFTGVIEMRHDTRQNVKCWYDFRNIKFRRWNVNAAAFVAFTPYVKGNIVKHNNVLYACISNVSSLFTPAADTEHWAPIFDRLPLAYFSWTADAANLNIAGVTSSDFIVTAALDLYTFGTYYEHVRNVEIGLNHLERIASGGPGTVPFSRCNNIVFFTADNTETCHDVYFLGSAQGNINLGNYVSNLHFAGENYKLLLGHYVKQSKIRELVHSSIFYGNNYDLNIGLGSHTLLITDQCNRITLGASNHDIMFGFACYSNQFGIANTNIVLGPESSNNTFGDENTGEFGRLFAYNNIGSSNIFLAAGTQIMRCNIGSSNVISFGNIVNDVTIGNSNSVNFDDNNVRHKIGYDSIIELGIGCLALTFFNSVVFQTNIAATGLQFTQFESSVNVTGVDFTGATIITDSYNKTVFTNANGDPYLRYFDAVNALIVDALNA